MTDLITAEEAGNLLDGTTPGPWELDGVRPHTAHVWPVDGCDDPITGEIDIDNAHLIAAAPGLARTVIALHAQLADANAALIREAEARGMERAADICEGIRTSIANGPMPEGARFDYEQSIRAEAAAIRQGETT